MGTSDAQKIIDARCQHNLGMYCFNQKEPLLKLWIQGCLFILGGIEKMYEVMRRGTRTDIWKNLQELLSAQKCKGSSLNAFPPQVLSVTKTPKLGIGHYRIPSSQ